MAAPFGVFFTTALLTYFVEQGQWQGAATGETAATLVDLAAVFYGMVAVLIERGFRTMFWALDKRKEWREKMRAEAHAEGYAAAKREFDTQLARLTRAAREQGITLEEPPPG